MNNAPHHQLQICGDLIKTVPRKNKFRSTVRGSDCSYAKNIIQKNNVYIFFDQTLENLFKKTKGTFGINQDHVKLQKVEADRYDFGLQPGVTSHSKG